MLQVMWVLLSLLLTIVVVVLIVAATRPSTFRVQRSASIKASPDRIFPHVNDFHKWPAWSPWEKMDPAMTRTHSGSDSGKGAVYAWKGNNKVGEGRMEITDSVSPSKVVIKLDFLRPFEAHNTAEFTLEAQGDSTNLTWAMHGPQPFMVKVMSVFMSMDKMVGKDFESGLSNLKTVAQG